MSQLFLKVMFRTPIFSSFPEAKQRMFYKTVETLDAAVNIKGFSSVIILHASKDLPMFIWPNHYKSNTLKGYCNPLISSCIYVIKPEGFKKNNYIVQNYLHSYYLSNC